MPGYGSRARPGILLGGFVAAQVGPVSLLCMRTATRHGFGPAVAIGAGAATVDVVYAALGVLGAAALIAARARRTRSRIRRGGCIGLDGCPDPA